MKQFIQICFFLSPFVALGQVDLTSSNLPIFVVTTQHEIVDEPKVDALLGIIWNGEGHRNNISDSFNHYDGKIGIEIRGASSQWFNKKSYSFETRNADDSNNNVSLLGLPAENDWVLHGPFSDKSLIRNAITYIMAGWIMDYAPRVRFCEVLLNDEYQGVYLLTEKIKRDINRVNIDKLEPDEIAGDDLTGGYILKIDKNAGAENAGWASSFRPNDDAWQETVFFYHYPKPEDIVSEQEIYIQNFMHDFEQSLKSSNFDDPLSGYRNFIDVTSFIDFMFINEIGRNVDGYRLSTYMHKNKDSEGGKLKMGPVWDFNLAYGNVDYCIGPGLSGWALDFNSFCPDDFWIIPFWWDRLREDVQFTEEVYNRWQTLRASQLSNTRIFNMVDSLENLLKESAERNFEQWDILHQYVWPNSQIGGSYENEVKFLKNWLSARLAWLDAYFDKFQLIKYYPADHFEPIAYPNPFHSSLTFDYYVRTSEGITIKIHNSLGALISEIQDYNHFNGSNSSILDTSGFPPGIYFYSFWIWDEKIQSGKLVKH